jgi:phenylalanyl-tRNA synthetase beta chain
MRVPFGWVKEFVPVTASAEEVAHRLTMVGLEVEALEPDGDEMIFEVNVTPNRPDCLSIAGIARELSAIYGSEIKIPEHTIISGPGELDINVDILDTALCRRYAGRVVRSLTIGPSPEWMKKRLEQCGIRSINNVVDVTNYVLLELGHPLHAFDLGTIRGGQIRVGTPSRVTGNNAALAFTTLDGTLREIPSDSLMIWDAERPVAVAGIMGGQDTEVTSGTKDVFIEGAYFDPVSIRRTAKTLGIKTESSYRFERGTDIKMLKKAIDRAAYLMKKVAGGVAFGKIDIYPKKYAQAAIRVSYDKISRVLGLTLTKEDISLYLKRLGFTVKENSDYCIVTPPAYRTDVSRDADIMEELARAYGYDRILAELPLATVGMEVEDNPEKDTRERLLGDLKESFLKAGFTEVINYSFMGEQDLEVLGLAEDDERRTAVRIRNPLRAEDSYMRTMLAPSLMRNVVHNVVHGNREFRLFEISKVFLNRRPTEAGLPEERTHCAAVLYREKMQTLYRENTPDFFIMKGLVEAVLNDLKIRSWSFVRSQEPFLHPGQSADILIGGERMGYLGALSPLVTDRLDISVRKPSLMLMEIDMNAVVPYAMQELKYMSLPKYPYIERDTAIIVDASLEAASIIGWLRDYPSDLIEDISLFDVYQGVNIPGDRKSIAFNVRYRALERTLRDEEIDSLHQALVEHVLGKTKGELRK